MSNAVTITAPEGVPFVEIVREFDAPVESVFAAYADPDLVSQWLGPIGYDMRIEQYDLVSGGRYRYEHTNPEGASYAFNGVFHTGRANEFIIQTFEFEGVPDVVSLEFLTFTDLGDGRTRITGHSTFPSLEARDGIVASGMEVGVTQGYERLDALLAA